jgi:hypothetical protein
VVREGFTEKVILTKDLKEGREKVSQGSKESAHCRRSKKCKGAEVELYLSRILS